MDQDPKTGAAIINAEEDEALEQRLDRAWSAIERIGERNADKDPDDVLRDVTEVVEQVRQERYEREQQIEAALRR